MEPGIPPSESIITYKYSSLLMVILMPFVKKAVTCELAVASFQFSAFRALQFHLIHTLLLAISVFPLEWFEVYDTTISVPSLVELLDRHLAADEGN